MNPIKIYAPGTLSLGSLIELAEQNNCTLNSSFTGEYHIIPKQAEEPKEITALGSSKITPLFRDRQNSIAPTGEST